MSIFAGAWCKFCGHTSPVSTVLELSLCCGVRDGKPVLDDSYLPATAYRSVGLGW
jgi:hypothetical protein